MDDCGFRRDEAVCGYDALKLSSEGGCLKRQDWDVSLVCEGVRGVGDVESVG